LPPTFSALAAWTFDDINGGASAERAADGVMDTSDWNAVMGALSGLTIDARNLFTVPLTVRPSGASAWWETTGAGCDNPSTGSCFVTTTFAVGGTTSTATLATPAACSKTGTNNSVTVVL
jgi:hypothetical protein